MRRVVVGLIGTCLGFEKRIVEAAEDGPAVEMRASERRWNTWRTLD